MNEGVLSDPEWDRAINRAWKLVTDARSTRASNYLICSSEFSKIMDGLPFEPDYGGNSPLLDDTEVEQYLGKIESIHDRLLALARRELRI